MNKSLQYAHQCLAACGFAVMRSEVAWKLRPDLWTSPQDCGFAFRPEAIAGTQRMIATLAGLAGPSLVLTRSTDQLAQRIEWVTGCKVVKIEAEQSVSTRQSADGGLSPHQRIEAERMAKVRALAATEPPIQDCALRKDILAARAELERLEPKPVPVSNPAASPAVVETTKATSEDDSETDGATAIEKASRLIADMLKKGPRNAAEIRTAAEGDGIGERTLQRAADALGVVKSKAGFAGGWTWALPAAEKAAA